MQERRAWAVSGYLGLLGVLALTVLGVIGVSVGAQRGDWLTGIAGAFALCVAFVGLNGFFVVEPNIARAIVFLGRYAGTIRQSGWWWTNPLTTKPAVSLRVRNFNTKTLKVNDAAGNPIEIAAVVVFRVIDSAKALFDVEEYEAFIEIQSETAVRQLANGLPYDAIDEEGPSLRGDPEGIAEQLRTELQARLVVAGVDVSEARLTHLVYAPEIASAMLQRQQATAILAARQKIVEGAVGLVQMAVAELSRSRVIDLDEERKAAMINNLMVAIIGERGVQPVINTGSLSQ